MVELTPGEGVADENGDAKVDDANEKVNYDEKIDDLESDQGRGKTEVADEDAVVDLDADDNGDFDLPESSVGEEEPADQAIDEQGYSTLVPLRRSHYVD